MPPRISETRPNPAESPPALYQPRQNGQHPVRVLFSWNRAGKRPRHVTRATGGHRRRFHAAGRCVPSSRRALTSRAPPGARRRSLRPPTRASRGRGRQRPAPRLDPRDDAPLERLVEPLGRRLVGRRQQDRQRELGRSRRRVVAYRQRRPPVPAARRRPGSRPRPSVSRPGSSSTGSVPRPQACSKSTWSPLEGPRKRSAATPDARRRKPQDEEARQGRVRRTEDRKETRGSTKRGRTTRTGGERSTKVRRAPRSSGREGSPRRRPGARAFRGNSRA